MLVMVLCQSIDYRSSHDAEEYDSISQDYHHDVNVSRMVEM